jgi:Ca-activated chloride channel family protein
MKWFAVLIHFLFFSQVVAQSSLSKYEADLGDLYSGTQRYVDIGIENNSSSPVYVLRIEQSPRVVYKLSAELVPANSFVTLRVQVNPTEKGTFEQGCNVFMSDRNGPLTFMIKGNVVQLPVNNYATTACPDFNSSPAAAKPSSLTIITKDKETNEVLASTKVVIIRNGEPAGAWVTGKRGSFNLSIPSGYFYFLATSTGYLNKEAGVYVGPEISEITIPLTRDPNYTIPDLAYTPPADSSVALTVDEAKEILTENVPITDKLAVFNPALSEISETNFDQEFFRPLNIEFVIDISSSMKQNDKMELMKYSLNQLVSQLRPVDRMGIVTYSDQADVFQVSTLGDRKEVISKAVSELKPQGMTAGGRGIKMGYRQLMLNYDPAKTNMVIIITDGAFNKDSDDYQKTVRKYAKKGIIFSVVGIQAKEKDEIQMTEAAAFGAGRYISIHQLSDAQDKLFQEIRIASFKPKP